MENQDETSNEAVTLEEITDDSINVPLDEIPEEENKTVDDQADIKLSRFQRLRTNPNVGLAIVCFAFFTDYLLLLSCIPVLPYYGAKLHLSAIALGLLFSSKSIAHVLSSPFMGSVADKLGRRTPMIAGLALICASTLLFAFGEHYGILLLARTCQGIASSANSTAGMAIIADLFPDNEVRGKKMSIAITSISLGVLAGAPFAGITVQFGGERLPFIIIAALVALDGIARALLLKDPPRVQVEVQPTTKELFQVYLHLIKDVEILLIAGCTMFGNGMIAMMETTYSLFLGTEMHLAPGYVGLCYGAGTLTYTIVVLIISRWVSIRKFRRVGLAVGLVIMGSGAMCILFVKHLAYVLFWWCYMGIGMAFIDSCSSPELAAITDERHPNSYGRVFAVSTASSSLGFIFGPIIGTALLKPLNFQFTWMGSGGVLIFYSVFVFVGFLRRTVVK